MNKQNQELNEELEKLIDWYKKAIIEENFPLAKIILNKIKKTRKILYNKLEGQ